MGLRVALAAEDDEEEPERVDAGQERPDEAAREEDVAEGAAVEHRGQDRVLREEAGEREDTDERERADEEDEPRVRHRPAEAAQLVDVLLAGEGVDRDAGREEEQRL